MARDITTIYSGIIDTKNSREELKDLNSTSQTAIYKLWAYVVSVAIFTHELLWDLFKQEISDTLDARINGTSEWYAGKALEYQDGDELLTLGDGAYLGYDPIVEENRIITRCSYFENIVEFKGVLNLKVAKGDASNLSNLDINEIGKVIKYFEKIKFAGTNILIVSYQADEILLDDLTVYHDGVRSDQEILSDIENAMDDYLINLPFDGQFYIEGFRDKLQKVANVVDIYIGTLSRDSYEAGDPNTPANSIINRRVTLDSGYAKIKDKSLIKLEIEEQWDGI